MSIGAILLLFGAATGTPPAWPFPATQGTTWHYVLTREPEQERKTLIRQIVAASRETEGTLRLEEKIDDAQSSAQLLRNEKGAVVATPERDASGHPAVRQASATLLPVQMQAGTSWNFQGEIAGTDVTLPLRIIAEEEIEVPAGKFRAWHIRGEKSGTVGMVADEWFALGVGWVKETITERSPTGQLLARRALEMTALPSAHGAPAAPVRERAFEASISTSTAGVSMDIISADALQIVARWRARPVGRDAKVRAVWIAEDTGGIASPGFKVDEATAIATAPESVGTFTLSRPPDGWAAGKYRVEFYFQEALVGTAHVTIAPRAAAVESGAEF